MAKPRATGADAPRLSLELAEGADPEYALALIALAAAVLLAVAR